MNTIKFVRDVTKENKITTTVHSTLYFDLVGDEYGNELYTDISKEKKRKISSITKQLDGCKYYIFVDTKTGEPIAMEHDEYGEIGGLWFKNRKLVDYDGCGCLPYEVVQTIRAIGYTVPRDFVS